MKLPAIEALVDQNSNKARYKVIRNVKIILVNRTYIAKIFYTGIHRRLKTILDEEVEGICWL